MADEMLKNAQPQELESQIGEEDGLKEQLLRACAARTSWLPFRLC